MNKLNIATTGYPGTTKSWRFVKDSYEMIADALAKLVDPDSPVVITGVKVIGTDVTEGYIAWKGELFYFKPGKKTDYVVIIEDREAVEYNTNPTNTGELEIHDTYISRYAKCGDQGEGIDSFPFADLIRMDSLIQISERTKNATTDKRGVIQIATIEEVNDGIDDQKAVTPASLQAKKATIYSEGIIQIATQAEVDEGTNINKAITPATLAHAISNAQQVIASGSVIIGRMDYDSNNNSGTFTVPINAPDEEYVIVGEMVKLDGDYMMPVWITISKTPTSFEIFWYEITNYQVQNPPEFRFDYIVLAKT